MKKKYHVTIIDFNGCENRGLRGRIVSERYADGLQDARHGLPCKIHYCKNAGCFWGFIENKIQVIVTECRTR